MRTRRTLALVCIAAALLASSNRVYVAHTQIQMIELALEAFHSDTGSYPSTEEGLQALIEEPQRFKGRGRYREGGYLQSGSIPKDPWGTSYQYRQPGEHDASQFDLWSLGADGRPGGTGFNADIGNWPGGFAEAERALWHETFVTRGLAGAGLGLVVGLPFYAYGVRRRVRKAGGPRSAYGGRPLVLLAAAVGAGWFFFAFVLSAVI